MFPKRYIHNYGICVVLREKGGGLENEADIDAYGA